MEATVQPGVRSTGKRRYRRADEKRQRLGVELGAHFPHIRSYLRCHMPDSPDNISPVGASNHAALLSGVDYDDCFAPSAPEASVVPTLKQVPRSGTLSTVVDECLSDLGILGSPATTNGIAGTPASIPAEDGVGADFDPSLPTDLSPGSETRPQAALVPERKATTAQIFAWIKKSVWRKHTCPRPPPSLSATGSSRRGSKTYCVSYQAS